ncbi:MAG: hypothetical protein JWN70_3088 [Planctomycetaceae bacterium]|nr:hypothetical protein [Planctomycetaceae bacterium]
MPTEPLMLTRCCGNSPVTGCLPFAGEIGNPLVGLLPCWLPALQFRYSRKMPPTEPLRF